MGNIKSELARLKDLHGRQFKNFTSNFYVLKSALRYYSENQGLSFTASKIGDDFPISVPAAGSSLKILSDLNVIQERTESSSASRYIPEDVDLERLVKIERILVKQLEIDEFVG